jgi:hypothetical protein
MTSESPHPRSFRIQFSLASLVLFVITCGWILFFFHSAKAPEIVIPVDDPTGRPSEYTLAQFGIVHSKVDGSTERYLLNVIRNADASCEFPANIPLEDFPARYARITQDNSCIAIVGHAELILLDARQDSAVQRFEFGAGGFSGEFAWVSDSCGYLILCGDSTQSVQLIKRHPTTKKWTSHRIAEKVENCIRRHWPAARSRFSTHLRNDHLYFYAKDGIGVVHCLGNSVQWGIGQPGDIIGDSDFFYAFVLSAPSDDRKGEQTVRCLLYGSQSIVLICVSEQGSGNFAGKVSDISGECGPKLRENQWTETIEASTGLVRVKGYNLTTLGESTLVIDCRQRPTVTISSSTPTPRL